MASNRLRSVAVVMVAAMAAGCTPDMVIPSEEEAAEAGRSAAAAASAFSDVFEQRLAEERSELADRFAGVSDPLFPSTTVDPLDLFDPINECRWTEAAALAPPPFVLTLPSFVAVTETLDDIPTFHANYDYGRCAPISGDVQVIAGPADPVLAVDSQVSAYRAVGDLTVVSNTPVQLAGTDDGRLVEIRTGGDLHTVFLAGTNGSGDVVMLTIHVPLDRWVDAADAVLDLLRGLELR
jgi:hypothetical protein